MKDPHSSEKDGGIHKQINNVVNAEMEGFFILLLFFKAPQFPAVVKCIVSGESRHAQE